MENNELTKKVIEWLETAAQKVGEFATNEIPPFIEQYLNWKFWEAGFGVASWFLFVGIFYLIYKKISSQYK